MCSLSGTFQTVTRLAPRSSQALKQSLLQVFCHSCRYFATHIEPQMLKQEGYYQKDTQFCSHWTGDCRGSSVKTSWVEKGITLYCHNTVLPFIIFKKVNLTDVSKLPRLLQQFLFRLSKYSQTCGTGACYPKSQL